VADLLENDKIKEIQSAVDEDAKLGHKSEQNHFFGYKNHIATTEERIITGLEITTGEAADSEHLIKIVEQSEENGVTVEEILGDTAYSSKGNLKYAKGKEIKLISKLHPNISNGTRQQEDGFIFNKDADNFQCPCGYLATRKAHNDRKKQGKNNRIVYHFDIEKMQSLSEQKRVLQGRCEKQNLWCYHFVRNAQRAQRVPRNRVFQGTG
jgi:hypothetical protein